MSVTKKFVVKYGLDNNSNPITNIADPTNAQDAATKNFSTNATNITSGTVPTARLGTGTGSSVLEVILAFEKVSSQKLAYKIVGRREGDIISAYANTDKANTVLGWKAQSTLEEALASAWKWEQKIRS